MGWNDLGKAGRLFFLVVKIDNCFGWDWGKEQVAICDSEVEFDHSAQLPTLPTSQSKSAQQGVGSDGKGKAQWLCF